MEHSIREIFVKTANKFIEQEKSLSKNLKKEFKAPNIKNENCEDQYVGLIRIERKNARFCEWIECSLEYKPTERTEVHKRLKEQKDVPSLAIVLESPHKSEYLHSPPTPACGKTGENLYKLLPKYINRINATHECDLNSKGIGYIDISSGVYRVVLVNAIQYQCSLGKNTKIYRDNIFNTMWSKTKVRANFAERLKQYGIQVVFNCCTSGIFQFRAQVQEIINDVLGKQAKFFHAYHPCKWQECIGIEPDGWKN